VARASRASDGRDTSTSPGASGRIEAASTSRTASTWSGTVRTYNVVADVVVSNSSAATG
jgi:hypothetical protein